jgi:putative zinc finger protein
MNDRHPSPDRWNDRLSEYLDEELEANERTALEAHLVACAECRADLDALRAVTARAASLRDTPPEADLWPGVAAALERRPRGEWRQERRFSFTLPQLVAAGLAIMVLSGGMVWLARMGGSRTDFPPVGAHSTGAPATFGDAGYDEAVADLERTLADARQRLDPDTVRVLDQNLSTIDRAIGQCRDALAADPGSAFLQTSLSQARARKLALLRQAAALAARNRAPRSL